MTSVCVVSRNPSLSFALSASAYDVSDHRPTGDDWVMLARASDVVVLHLDDPEAARRARSLLIAAPVPARVLFVASSDDPGWESLTQEPGPPVAVLPLPISGPSLIAAVDGLVRDVSVRAPVEESAGVDDQPTEHVATATSPADPVEAPPVGPVSTGPEPPPGEVTSVPHPPADAGGGQPTASFAKRPELDPLAAPLSALTTSPADAGDGRLPLEPPGRDPDAGARPRTSPEPPRSSPGALSPAHLTEVATAHASTVLTESAGALPAGPPAAVEPEPMVMITLPAAPEQRPPSTPLPPVELVGTSAQASVSGHIRALAGAVPNLSTIRELGDLVVLLAVEATESVAGALLLPDGDVWRVCGGYSLRSIEDRAQLESDHWLVNEVPLALHGVIVEHSDVARQRLRGAPLASRDHLLVAPVPEVSGLLLVARDENGYTEDDLARLADVGREARPVLADGLELRSLARLLDDFRDPPG